MISYNLTCADGHEFEGWFKGSKNFDIQCQAGDVACPVCGNTEIRKALSAPNISTSRSQANARTSAMIQARQAIQEMRKVVETQCENVGENFAEEVRKIHYGETKSRGIYGQATADESREMIEEGIEFLPLPWIEEEKKN